MFELAELRGCELQMSRGEKNLELFNKTPVQICVNFPVFKIIPRLIDATLLSKYFPIPLCLWVAEVLLCAEKVWLELDQEKLKSVICLDHTKCFKMT